MSQFNATNDIIMDNIVVDEKGHNVVNGSFAHKPDGLLFYYVKLPQHQFRPTVCKFLFSNTTIQRIKIAHSHILANYPNFCQTL